MDTIFEVRHLSKSFGSNEVLRDIDFDVRAGDVTSIIGASGSGKSTLLRCINLLETPSRGAVRFHGEDVAGRRVNTSAYRSKVGMVFQSFNLFANMNVLENCMAGPVKVLRQSREEARRKALRYLEQVGMAPYINAYPHQLSGGQKQRAAVARALIAGPRLVLADEPTGALDSKAANALLDVFGEINRQGQTILMVTHSAQAASRASRVLFIKDGEVFHQIYRGEKTKEEMYQMISDTLTILMTGGEYHA